MIRPCGRRLRIAASGARIAGKFPAALAALGGPEVPSRQLNVFSRNIEPKIYGRVGNLEVRLARTWSEIKLAQRLRYQVFYEEMSAVPTRLAQFRRRDEDAYDAICDHLLVVDLDQTKPSAAAARNGPRSSAPTAFFVRKSPSADRVSTRRANTTSRRSFDAQVATNRFMELGRSCVLAPYRSKRSVELLWHGLWTYVRENRIDVMIGCASFEGTDLE